MLQAKAIYHRSLLLPFFIFLLSGILAISLQQPWWILVPFIWVLAPPAFVYIITHTEQLFWLLFITLPLSTELNITPALGLDFPDEILLLLLTGMALVKLVHQPQWFPRSLLTHPLFAVLIIYLCWVLITCIFSAEPVLSVKYLLAKTWYIVPFVVLPQILLNSKDRLQKMAVCLLIPMLFVVIQVLVRYSFYSFSFEMVKKTMAPFFRNHVNYSSMLVCLLPVAWCVWKLTPAHHPKRNWILYGIGIGLFGLFFAYSRGAWIALLAGLCIVWVIRKKIIGKLIFVAIAGILISSAWLITDKNFMKFIPDHDRTYYHTDFGEHMLATVKGKDISAAERLYRWVAGARMLADKPITGFGPNSFYLHYRPYTVSRFQTWVSDNPEHSTVHNYFLLIALEQGIIGLVLFSILYFGMLLNIQRIYHALQSTFYKTIALTTGIILTMIGAINCMSDMIETDKIGSLFWLCLGIVVLLQERLKEEKLVLA
jgi:O-antigen ligase